MLGGHLLVDGVRRADTRALLFEHDVVLVDVLHDGRQVTQWVFLEQLVEIFRPLKQPILLLLSLHHFELLGAWPRLSDWPGEGVERRRQHLAGLIPVALERVGI